MALDQEMLKTNDRLVRTHDRQLGELIQTTKSLTKAVDALVKMNSETTYVSMSQFKWVISAITGSMILFGTYTVDKVQTNQLAIVKIKNSGIKQN